MPINLVLGKISCGGPLALVRYALGGGILTATTMPARLVAWVLVEESILVAFSGAFVCGAFFGGGTLALSTTLCLGIAFGLGSRE